MSLAVIKMALAKAFHRDPTPDELSEFLQALAKNAAGDRVYIPQAHRVDDEAIRRLRAEGVSIRKIARKVGCSKSYVGRLLRQSDLYESVPKPDLFVDTAA